MPRLLLILALLLVALIVASFAIGRYPVPPDTVLAILAAKVLPIAPDWPPETEAVVLGIRLPRIFAALLVGAALTVSGASYQGLFRNPMVSPGILGVSAGASLGAALAILLGYGMLGIQALAFACGLIAVAATWLVGSTLGRRGGDPLLTMVLAGIVVGTLFTAFVSLVKFVADPNNTLPTITFWLMGSLASVELPDLLIATPPILLGLTVLLVLSWTLNVLCFGDEEAKAMGLETGRLRLAIIVSATLVITTKQTIQFNHLPIKMHLVFTFSS